MSEDFHQLPGEPEKPGQPPTEQPRPVFESVIPEQAAEQPRPMSESVIPEQPAAAQEAAQPQYPPPPEFYARMPVVDPYSASGAGPGASPSAFPPPDQGVPAYPPPGQREPVFPPPPGYGYGSPPPGYGYPPLPQAQPLPLGQAVRELPRQYEKILLKPGPRSFEEEQGKAEWGIIWLQVIFLTILQVMVSVSVFRDYNQTLANNASLASSGMDVSIFSSSTILPLEIGLMVIFVPLIFFASVGIQYLVARAFKGIGNMKQQAYNQILFQMPIMIISALLSLVVLIFAGSTLGTPASGAASTSSMSGPVLLVLLLVDLISLGINVYSVVLNVFSLMATHRMTGGKATASVLIPYGILIVLGLLCACALGVALAVAMGGTVQP